MTVSQMSLRPDPRAWREHRFGLSPERWLRLDGKAFWITGAGSGFGRAVAIALAAAGAVTVLTGRRPGRLEETRAEMATLGIATERAIAVPADITDTSAVDMAVRAIDARVGGLNGLVNNAGTIIAGLGPWPLAEQSVGDWDRLFNLNLRAHWYVTKAALPLLVRRGEIKALFISSGAGWASTPGVGPYNVSKAGLNSLAMSFAAECAARYPTLDVQINVVNPGEARTELNGGSSESPFILANMALLLLSHEPGGPNGRFFAWHGGHLAFCDAMPWEEPLQ
jgi:3-oxoacyl-[acyl-carrier protein] reductase